MDSRRPRERPRSARTGRRSLHTGRGRRSTPGPGGAGRAIGAPAYSSRRPRNSTRCAAARPQETWRAAWAQPLDRGAAVRSDPDAWRRRGRGRASRPAAHGRVTWANGRIQRRRNRAGSVRTDRPAPLLLELAGLPGQFLLLSRLVVVRSGHEGSSIVAGLSARAVRWLGCAGCLRLRSLYGTLLRMAPRGELLLPQSRADGGRAPMAAGPCLGTKDEPGASSLSCLEAPVRLGRRAQRKLLDRARPQCPLGDELADPAGGFRELGDSGVADRKSNDPRVAGIEGACGKLRALADTGHE